MKVDRTIKGFKLPVKALVTYWENGNIYSDTDNNGEDPHLFIARKDNKKYGQQINIEFRGEKHFEPHRYISSSPKEWKSFGRIVMTDKQTEKLIMCLSLVVASKYKVDKEQTTLDCFLRRGD